MIQMLVRVQEKGGEIKEIIVNSDYLTPNECATMVIEIAKQFGIDATAISARQLM